MAKIKELQEEQKVYKEEVRGLIIDLNRKVLSNEQWKVEMRRAYSLDLGYLKMKYPEIARGYIEQKIEDYIEDKDKKIIREKFPDAWNNCSVELTP